MANGGDCFSRKSHQRGRLLTSASPPGSSLRGGPCLVEVEELTVQAAALVQVAARNLDSSGVGAPAHLERVEAGGADQPFDRCRRSVVIRGVEEHCARRLT